MHKLVCGNWLTVGPVSYDIVVPSGVVYALIAHDSATHWECVLKQYVFLRIRIFIILNHLFPSLRLNIMLL